MKGTVVPIKSAQNDFGFMFDISGNGQPMILLDSAFNTAPYSENYKQKLLRKGFSLITLPVNNDEDPANVSRRLHQLIEGLELSAVTLVERGSTWHVLSHYLNAYGPTRIKKLLIASG
ncbi:hypothetical protein [Zhongshania marina]|uniref:Uncharacterized protein n=1 Tax=Zhongshania marina TaxID=2304603 RepID=A0A2S4HLD7_9GAMM|nr:hypothetical protein [Marortus luteolus]POP54501.1 hypothetical protein C0068_01570 [Marortus luteolus]